MKILQIIFALSLLLFIDAGAQSIGGGFMMGIPRGQFDKMNPDNGYGLQVQFMLVSPGYASPLGIGFDAGFLYYSSTHEHRPLSPTIPDVGVEVDRINSMANAHLVLQVCPSSGFVRPYAEAYTGFSYFFTKTEVSSEYDDEVIFSHVNFDDFAFSYGFGGGLKILLSNPVYESNDIFLNLKVRYLNGSEAEYLTEEDIGFDTRTRGYEFSPRRSKTDMLTWTIGVELRL